MDVQFDSKELLASRAFASPVRLGVFIHLAAMVSSTDDLRIMLKPSVLAEHLQATRGQVEDAIASLAKHGIVRLDKKEGQRGEWLIDLGPSSHYLHGDWCKAMPTSVPVRELMQAWDKGMEVATGSPPIRMWKDYWREKTDWTTLFEALGPKIFVAIEAYFQDKANAQWDYNLTVFCRKAQSLAELDDKRAWRT